jgi:hypothetical protein
MPRMNTRRNGRRNAAVNADPVGAAPAAAVPVADNQGRRVDDGEKEEGVGLQNLFQEPVRNAAGAWTDAEIDQSWQSRSKPVGYLSASDIPPGMFQGNPNDAIGGTGFGCYHGGSP